MSDNAAESGAASKYTLQSLDKSLKVLDLFFQRNELGPSDVETIMDVNKSIAFRILTTLHENGYLTKTNNGRYRLGMKLFSLGQAAYRNTELVSYARPHLLKLSESCSETCNLAMFDGDRNIVFLDKCAPHSPLRLDTDVGARYVAHLTASGRAILAYQPYDIVSAYLKRADYRKLTENSPDCQEEVEAIFKQTRAQGWSADREECIPGLTCFAAPILDRTRRSAAAISCSGATTRMMAKEEDIVAKVRDAAYSISKMLW